MTTTNKQYVVKTLDGEEIVFKSPVDVMDYLSAHEYQVEPNANIFGIDSTIKNSGRVCIYKNGNDTDYIDGEIIFSWRIRR